VVSEPDDKVRQKGGGESCLDACVRLRSGRWTRVHTCALSVSPLCSIVRFSPMSLAPDQLSLVHGTNERILVEDFKVRAAGVGGSCLDACVKTAPSSLISLVWS
jgi:hypothetical protein